MKRKWVMKRVNFIIMSIMKALPIAGIALAYFECDPIQSIYILLVSAHVMLYYMFLNAVGKNEKKRI